MIVDYRALLDRILGSLDAGRYDAALALVRQAGAQHNVAGLAAASDADLRPLYAAVGGNPLALLLVVGQLHLSDLPTVLADLQEAWRDMLKRARLVQHHKITREELSVREHMGQVLKALQGRRFVEFEALFDPSRGSTVLVVTFIALLELAKETLIEITQAEAFSPIYVRLAYTPA